MGLRSEGLSDKVLGFSVLFLICMVVCVVRYLGMSHQSPFYNSNKRFTINQHYAYKVFVLICKYHPVQLISSKVDSLLLRDNNKI